MGKKTISNHWIFKTEPDCYSIDDLRKKGRGTWDGVRNFQARNFIRDDMKKGDKIIFYHSSCAIPAAVGVAEIVKEGYPDDTALDPKSEHPDPRHTRARPLWYVVDIKFLKKFKNPVALSDMHRIPELRGMRLLARGNRLSVFPIDEKQFKYIVKIGK